jgi:hypothetical protein
MMPNGTSSEETYSTNINVTNSTGRHLTKNGTNSTVRHLTKNGTNSTGTYLANNENKSTGSSLSRKTTIWEDYCDEICNKGAVHCECCGSLWRFLDDSNPIEIEFSKSNILKFPRVHGVILIVLSSLFLLSILEGLLELCVPFMPYRLLYSYTPIRFQQNQ